MNKQKNYTDIDMEGIIKQTMMALPEFIEELAFISKDFNKFVKSPRHMDKIVDGFGAIICIDGGNLYKDINENTLLSLKENIKMFSKAVSYYFEEVEKNIDSTLEDKSKDNLENMSREELLQYIKEHNL